MNQFYAFRLAGRTRRECDDERLGFGVELYGIEHAFVKHVVEGDAALHRKADCDHHAVGADAHREAGNVFTRSEDSLGVGHLKTFLSFEPA